MPALIVTRTINPNMNETSRNITSFTTNENENATTILVYNRFSEFTFFQFEKLTNGTQTPVTFFATNCDNGTASLNIDETLSLDILTLPRIIFSKYLLVGSKLTVTITFTEVSNSNVRYLVFDDISQALEFSQTSTWNKTYTEISELHSPFNYTLLVNRTSFYYIVIYGLMEFDGMINLTVQGIVIQYNVQYSMDEACTIDKTENNCSFSVQENRYSENSSLCLFVSHPSANFSNHKLTVHSFYVTGSRTVTNVTFWVVIGFLAFMVVLAIICVIIVISALIHKCKQRYSDYVINKPVS